MDEDEQMKTISKAQGLAEYLDKHEFDRISKSSTTYSPFGLHGRDRDKSIAQLSGG